MKSDKLKEGKRIPQQSGGEFGLLLSLHLFSSCYASLLQSRMVSLFVLFLYILLEYILLCFVLFFVLFLKKQIPPLFIQRVDRIHNVHSVLVWGGGGFNALQEFQGCAFYAVLSFL